MTTATAIKAIAKTRNEGGKLAMIMDANAAQTKAPPNASIIFTFICTPLFTVRGSSLGHPLIIQATQPIAVEFKRGLTNLRVYIRPYWVGVPTYFIQSWISLPPHSET